MHITCTLVGTQKETIFELYGFYFNKINFQLNYNIYKSHLMGN